MKKVIFLASICTLLFASCENDKDLTGIPSCIQDTMNRADINSSPDASLSEFLYKGQRVYMFDPGVVIPDWLYTVVNEDCEVICEFGGIAGLNTCPDFEAEAELIREIKINDN